MKQKKQSPTDLTVWNKHVVREAATSYKVGDIMDVVYTYVDCDDPSWRKKFEIHSSKTVDPVRHCNLGEIYVSLASVEAFLNVPIRYIFIVTDGQKLDHRRISPWVKSKIRYVFHEAIIPASFLPVFNSMAIEACLHKIPGITPFFMYFNDDVFVGKPVTLSHLSSKTRFLFFTRPPRKKVIDDPRVKKPVWYAWRDNAADMFFRYTKGRVCANIRTNHGPVVLSRASMEEMWSQFGEELSRNTMTPFRSQRNVNAWFLASCIAAYRGEVELRPNDGVCHTLYCEQDSDSDALIRDVRTLLSDPSIFISFNNLMEECDPSWRVFRDMMLRRTRALVRRTNCRKNNRPIDYNST